MSPFVNVSSAIDSPAAAPESTSASTIISFDSIDSALSTLSSLGIKENVSTQPSGLLAESVDPNTPRSANPGQFTLHKRFFFDDGNLTFLVDGMLYRVHRYFFCRDSNEFVRRLSQFRSKGAVISLDDVKSKDFDAFLSVLYPLNFNASDERSFKEWTSILDLSTRWGFTTIRDLAIRCLKPPTPLQRLLLARKYGVEEWMLPALQELCERPLPLTLDEARLMDVEDIVLVGSVRETVRSHVLAVKSAGIGDCIEAWRSGKPWQRPAEERAAPAANCLAPVGVAKDPIPHHAELNGAATMSARHLDRIHGLSTASVPATITPANDAGSSVASDDEWGTWPPAKKKKGSR